MSKFSELVQRQRKSGKGVLSSLGTAVGQTTLEKIDPRNYLFNRSGVLAALFPSLKGYQAKASPAERIKQSTTSNVQPILMRLDTMGADSSIAAKNFIMLPHLAREINLVRQNIVKLVKAEGQTPATKADMFFLKAKEREAAYESQSGGTKPTPVNESRIFSKKWVDALLGTALLTGLTTLFLNEAFRKKMLEYVGQAFEYLGFSVKNIFTGFVAILGTLIVAKIAFKATAMLATALIIKGVKSLYRFIGLPATILLAAVGVREGKEMYDGIFNEINQKVENLESTQGPEPTEDLNGDGKIDDADRVSQVSPTPEKQIDKANLAINSVVAAAATADAVGRVKDISARSNIQGYNQKAGRFVDKSGKFVSTKDLPKSDMLRRFFDFAKKAAAKGWWGKLGGKLAVRLGTSLAAKVMVFFGGLVVPGAGWFASAVSMALLATDVYLIYDAIFGEGGIQEELEAEDKAENKVNAPTPVAQESTAPSKVNNPLGEPVVPGTGQAGTFGALTKEQQDNFLEQQFRMEGNRPGNLAYDLNNPGAMLYADWQKQFGATPNASRGVVGKPFAEFPTLEQGKQAQRYLWSTAYANKPLAQAVATWSGTTIGSKRHADYYAGVTGSNTGTSLQMDTPRTSSVPSAVAQNMSVKNDSSVTYNIDTKTVTERNDNTGGDKGKEAEAYDQFFAMLFMTNPTS